MAGRCRRGARPARRGRPARAGARRRQRPQAIAAARERLASGDLIPVRENYEGAARLKTRTVEEMAEDREAANKQAGESDKAQERPAATG